MFNTSGCSVVVVVVLVVVVVVVVAVVGCVGQGPYPHLSSYNRKCHLKWGRV